jgi:hypothetical protein
MERPPQLLEPADRAHPPRSRIERLSPGPGSLPDETVDSPLASLRRFRQVLSASPTAQPSGVHQAPQRCSSRCSEVTAKHAPAVARSWFLCRLLALLESDFRLLPGTVFLRATPERHAASARIRSHIFPLRHHSRPRDVHPPGRNHVSLHVLVLLPGHRRPHRQRVQNESLTSDLACSGWFQCHLPRHVPSDFRSRPTNIRDPLGFRYRQQPAPKDVTIAPSPAFTFLNDEFAPSTRAHRGPGSSQSLVCLCHSPHFRARAALRAVREVRVTFSALLRSQAITLGLDSLSRVRSARPMS